MQGNLKPRVGNGKKSTKTRNRNQKRETAQERKKERKKQRDSPDLNLPRRHAQLARKFRALLRARERRTIVRRIQRPQLIRVRAPAFRLQRGIASSSSIAIASVIIRRAHDAVPVPGVGGGVGGGGEVGGRGRAGARGRECRAQ